MSKGLPRSLARGSLPTQEVVKSILKLNAQPITVSGATGIGFGSVEISDFPEGNILFLGAVAYFKFSKTAGATGVLDTFTGSYSVGSAATADATLSGSEVDVIPSTVVTAATAGVSPVIRGANATQIMLDNTDGSLELNLNLLIDDASISAASQGLTVTGELYLAYIVLADD